MSLSEHVVPLVLVGVLANVISSLVDASQETVTDDPKAVQLGPIRHKELPPALIERVRVLEPIFADVYPITHEQWLEGFQRDAHPEKEIAIWEEIALAYTAFTEGRNLSMAIKREAFGLLLFRSGATAETTLEQAKLKYLTRDEARKLLKLYKAPPQPVTVEER